MLTGLSLALLLAFAPVQDGAAVRQSEADFARGVELQQRGDLVPHHIGLGVTVQQHEGWPLAAAAGEQLARGSIDPVRFIVGKQISEVGHGVTLMERLPV